MKKNSLLALLIGGMLATPGAALAEWGNLEAPDELMISDQDFAVLKAARTADGKTFISWLQYDGNGSGYNVHLMLVDADGNKMWNESLCVEDRLNASWTADYSLVVTDEGDAVISWADARSLEGSGEQWPNAHDPVLYKISQEGKHLWGENGVEIDNELFLYPPLLYKVGSDIYAIMTSADDWSPNQIARLAEDGSFATTPKVFTASQIYPIGENDFVALHMTADGTAAMRYNRDIEPVWENQTIVSSYLYGGHDRVPYKFAADGQGGVVISFDRAYGNFGQMPTVQHLTADGEATFGDSQDVLGEEIGVNAYNVIGVNPDSEEIMCAWQMTSMGGGIVTLGGQKFDFFGERMWGEEAIALAQKESESGYSYGSIAIKALSDDKWFVCYADELGWATNRGYVGIFDADGNESSLEPFGSIGALSYPKPFFDGNDFYLIYLNELTDDDWNTTYFIETVKVADIDVNSAVEEVKTAQEGDAEYYTIDGLRTNGLQKGLNIVKEADGSVRKVMVRK